MTNAIDLRSDTATLPDEEMREAMYKAELGDDILGEDPTVKELEERTASLLGMEDAILTISGTMSNQIATMVMTNRGDEVITGDAAHLYNLEVAGLASHSQVQPRTIAVENGYYDVDKIEAAIQPEGIQNAKTGLICLENTYDLNEGAVVTVDNMAEVGELAKSYNIPVYLDGARLFNASAYLGVEPADICKHVDAVQFCLTKGLGCPLGSMLAGSESFIQEAKRIRQRLGGGMRQAGVIAAPGITGLTKMVDGVQDDHDNCTKLYEALSVLPGINMDKNQTNILSIDITKDGWDADQLIQKLKNDRILVKKIGKQRIRMVTHHQISQQDVDKVAASFREILGG